MEIKNLLDLKRNKSSLITHCINLKLGNSGLKKLNVRCHGSQADIINDLSNEYNIEASCLIRALLYIGSMKELRPLLNWAVNQACNTAKFQDALLECVRQSDIVD